MIFRTISILLAGFALPAASLAQAPQPATAQTQPAAIAAPSPADPWPFAASDLPVDPGYRFGVLDNGMRYIIRSNGTPAEQGMVYLWIDSGSMNEEDDQRGYAHFLEHMAFNGSRQVSEGEMIRLLEREGLAFGPDTNASTSFDATIYKLRLPRNDPALLDTALMLMRETASELTLGEEAVEREIGVIQSERRVRDTFQMRNTLDQIDFLYPGSQFAARWVGGTDETILAATAQRLRDYYQDWYRPENSALIVVGDFDPALVEREIRDRFSDWQGTPGGKPSDGGPIPLDLAGQTDIHIDPALSESITISRHGPYIAPADSVAARRERLLLQIGYGIVNRRMQRLARIDDPPFRAAGLYTSDVFETARTSSLVVQAAEGEWQRGLAAAQEEYRRALDHGFSEAEVAEQIANLRSAIETSAAGADTRDNAEFVGAAIALLERGQIPTTPQGALQRFTEFAPSITPGSVLEALKREFVPLHDPLIRFTGRTPPEGGEAALRSAWEDGMQMALGEREAEAVPAFGYAEFGPPGQVVSDTVEPLLGIRLITFANGLRLNLKQTDLERDRVAIQLNIDGGKMLDTPEQPLATAMTSSLLVGGLGRHTLDELQSILAGRQVGANISAQDETFRVDAATTPGDLAMQLELLAAMIFDPGFRPQGEAQYRRNVASFFAQLDATPESALNIAEDRIISDNDPRFSLQSEEQYMALTFAGLREAIADRLERGAMELALVGDFEEPAAIDLVARTLGALPQREADLRDYAQNRERSFTGDRSPRTVSHKGESNQAIVKMIWPTRDDADLQQALQLSLLEKVTRLELVDTLREELGQTYSPSARSNLSRVYPGWGTFAIAAAVDTQNIEAARAAMLETVERLRDQPVDEDTLLRARAPQLEAYDNALKTNSGWMGLVDRAQSEADRIERFTTGKELLRAVTADQLQAMARLYLDPERRLEIVVLPNDGSAQ